MFCQIVFSRTATQNNFPRIDSQISVYNSCKEDVVLEEIISHHPT